MRKRQKIKLPPKLRQAVKRAGKPVKGDGKKGGGKSVKKKKNPIEAMKEDFRRKFKRIKWSRVFQQAIPYIVFGYFGDMIGCAYRVTNAADFFNRLLGAINNLGVVMSTRIISLHPFDLFAGIVFGAGLRAVVYFKGKNAKKFRKGEEYGSARWGTQKDIEPYMDLDNPDNNVILTQTEGILMEGRPSSPKYARNKNILVIGGSGSGKTRFFVKPNIMQMHSSYVITDPKITVS